MQSASSHLTESSQTIDSEIISYKYFNSFHLFLFSRNSSNQPQFLLYKSSKTEAFSHFHGHFTKHDPTIYFAVAREFVTHTRGLFHKKNLKYFLPENNEAMIDEELFLQENHKGPVRPQKLYSETVDDICRLLAETPYIFQDDKESVYYFVELPLLNLELLNEVAKNKEIDVELRYFSYEDISNKQNKGISSELQQCLENQKLLKYMEKYIISSEPVEIKEHYAVLSCDPKNPNALIHALNYPVLKKHGEHWRFYKAFEFDFPTDEELKKLKGIVIPGSGHSAYQTDVPWYDELFKCLNKIVNEHKHINLLCICFGAQIISQALGGKVMKMSRPFNRGGDLITTQSSFFELDYVKSVGFNGNFPFVIGKAHGDHIVELPTGAVLHGSSDVTNVELFTIGDKVLAFQGHPEFNEAFVTGAHYRSKKLEWEDYETEAEKHMEEMFKNSITQKELLNVCFNFLKK